MYDLQQNTICNLSRCSREKQTSSGPNDDGPLLLLLIHSISFDCPLTMHIQLRAILDVFIRLQSNQQATKLDVFYMATIKGEDKRKKT